MEVSYIFYDEKFKRDVVSEVESGELSVLQASRKYKIGGKMTIYGWLKKYGKFGSEIEKRSKMKKKKPAETPEEKIEELESELFLYKKLIEVSTYFRDPAVKKKIVEGLCAYYGKSVEEIIQMDIPLLRSVNYSELAGRAITSMSPEQKDEKNEKTGLSSMSKESEP
jgi:transposase-like protein